MKREYGISRDPDFTTEGDRYLPTIQKLLEEYLTEIEYDTDFDYFPIPRKKRLFFAFMLTDFYHDLHCNIGIWSALENYNKRKFGTFLPMFVENDYVIKEKYDINRFRYFIFFSLRQLMPKYLIDHNEDEFDSYVGLIHNFMMQAFSAVPKNSGLKKMLSTKSNKYADFKTKAVYIGKDSYLFRNEYYDFLSDMDRQMVKKFEINYIDSFLRNYISKWSGVTPAELTAEIVKLPNDLKKDVNTWYDTNIALYKILDINKNIVKLQNAVTQVKYNVFTEIFPKVMVTGRYFHTTIVYYGKQWHWSGMQIMEPQVEEAINIMKTIEVYFVSPDYYKSNYTEINELWSKLYEKFIKQNGTDFMILNNYQEIKTIIKNLTKGETYQGKPFIVNIINGGTIFAEQGIKEIMKNSKTAFYITKEYGIQIFPHFDKFLEILEKDGIDLSDYDKGMIQFLMYDRLNHPVIYKKIFEIYGDKSLREALSIIYDFDYLEFFYNCFSGDLLRRRIVPIRIKDKF